MILDGIYFGLDDDVYHADSALGSTDLKQIYLDPVDWQYDRLNKQNEDTDAMAFGRALHSRVLEGRDVFNSKFCGIQEKPIDALITNEDLSVWLKSNGLSDKGKKADLIERIQNSGLAQPKIWEVLREEFSAANLGKFELTEKQFSRVETAASWMQKDQTLSVMMEDGSFTLGEPEVSIFYTFDGVRLKARFDYLIGHSILDLKTFAPMYKEVPKKSIARAIGRQRYDLQCAAYVKAWHEGRALFKSGKIFGEPKCKGLLEKVYSYDQPLWVWVFLKTISAPQPFVRSMSHEEMVFKVADSSIENSIKTYKEKLAEFGADSSWPPNHDPEQLTSTDFPAYFQD